jgi:glycosyltransferase involved in cell wall biosynthesis
MANTVGKSLVTIGLPVYNMNSTIEASIKSILNQTYNNIELIISDNSSDDGTSELCRKYAELDSRVKLIRQSATIPPWTNFEFVLKISSGEFFKFHAGDDEISENYIESNLKNIKNGIGSCGLDLWDFEHKANNFSEARNFEFTGNHENRLKEFLNNAWLSHGIFYGLYVASEIKKVFTDDISGGNFLIIDWLICLRLVSLGEVRRDKNSYLVLGSEGAGSTSLNWKKQLRTVRDVFFPYRYFFEKILNWVPRDLTSRRLLLKFKGQLYFGYYKGLLRTNIPFWKLR